MEAYFLYLLKATFVSLVLYLLYVALFRNNVPYKWKRSYLLISLGIMLALPLSNYSLAPEPVKLAPEVQLLPQLFTAEIIQPEKAEAPIPSKQPKEKHRSLNVFDVAVYVYWTIAMALTLRILYSLILIFYYYFRSKRERLQKKYTIIFHPSIQTSYSFFKWIFIHPDIKNTPEKQNILNHEIVHARQYHSIDVLMVELLSAVMWFNPMVWLMRKQLQQLHEYLADEGVLNSGVNVLEYQTLLVNQVAGDKLIHLPSGFNQSLIKKRLTMMTNKQFSKNAVLRLLTLVPVTACMFLILAFTNKKEQVIVKVKKENQTALIVYKLPKPQFKSNYEDTTKLSSSEAKIDTAKKSHLVLTEFKNYTTAVAPTKMNVFYLGVDNPVVIAVAGVPAEKVSAKISNGTIRKDGDRYIVNPMTIGPALVTVYAEVDGRKEYAGILDFRVKSIPSPIVTVATKKGGLISKSYLLQQEEVFAIIENFDFDVKFKVIEFTVSANIRGFVQEAVSNSSRISEQQKLIIGSIKPGDRVYFQDIKALGPEGLVRELPNTVFKIVEENTDKE